MKTSTQDIEGAEVELLEALFDRPDSLSEYFRIPT